MTFLDIIIPGALISKVNGRDIAKAEQGTDRPGQVVSGGSLGEYLTACYLKARAALNEVHKRLITFPAEATHGISPQSDFGLKEIEIIVASDYPDEPT